MRLAAVVLLAFTACGPPPPCVLAEPRAASPRVGEVLHVSPEGKLVDPAGVSVRLRCVNLAGWMNREPYLLGPQSWSALTLSPSELRARFDGLVGEAKAEELWARFGDRFITEQDFLRIASLGFNCVRVPFPHHQLAAVGPDGGLVPKEKQGFELLDRALTWGERHGLRVVLDLHSTFGGQNDVATVADVPSSDTTARLWVGPTAEENQRLTVELWRLVAQRFGKRLALAGYDVLNEPKLPASADACALARFYERTVAGIREVDERTLLFLEGNRFARDFSRFGGVFDRNQAWSLHAYTLLSPEWQDPKAELRSYAERARRDEAPFWIGEFGEESLSWQRALVDAAESNDMGWAAYPWKRRAHQANPALLTFELPARWTKVFEYLVKPDPSKRPTADEAEAALDELLDAAQVERCHQDDALVEAFTSR